MRQPFRNGGFTNTRFAEQRRIILGATAKNADDALNFVLTAHHGVQRTFLRQSRQVPAKRGQRRSFGFTLPARFVGRPHAGRGSWPGRFRPRLIVGIHLFENGFADLIRVHIQIAQNARGHAFALAQQAQQEMFGADIIHVHRARFRAGQSNDLLDARRIGHIAHGFHVGTHANSLFHLHADGLQVQPGLAQNVNRHAFTKGNQPQ